jgi:hypothetical protein
LLFFTKFRKDLVLCSYCSPFFGFVKTWEIKENFVDFGIFRVPPPKTIQGSDKIATRKKAKRNVRREILPAFSERMGLPPTCPLRQMKRRRSYGSLLCGVSFRVKKPRQEAAFVKQ